MVHTTIRRGQESFPRQVRSVEELPAAVLRALEQHHAANDLDQLLVIPPQTHPQIHEQGRRSFFYTQEKTPQRTLVFDTTQILIIEEKDADTLNVITIPAEDLVSVQIDRMLLFSYFTLHWIAADGIQQICVHFNSVAEKLIVNGLIRVQQRLMDRFAPHPNTTSTPFSTNDFPLKFQNFARSSRMPGEEIRFAVYEPRVNPRWRDRLRFVGQPFGRIYQEPNRVIMLTDQRLIVIEDQLPYSRDTRNHKYRVNRIFYPRDKVLRTHIESHDKFAWICLTMGTPGMFQEIMFPLSEANLTGLRQQFSRWFLRQ